jgi:uncharacterized integral membrane protein
MLKQKFLKKHILVISFILLLIIIVFAFRNCFSNFLTSLFEGFEHENNKLCKATNEETEYI